MAATWLPQLFFGHPHLFGPVQANGSSRVGAAGAIQLPVQAAQFHQFRSRGIQFWFSGFSGLDSIAANSQPLPVVFGVALAWQPATAPGEFLKTWQFRQRNALFPREPCRA